VGALRSLARQFELNAVALDAARSIG
jgi:hypothetical protein